MSRDVWVTLTWRCLIHVTACVMMTSSCSEPLGGYEEPSMAERAHYAGAILYGHVTATYPSPHGPTAYTVSADVYCSLKGPRLPASVNITDAGYVPGMCESYDMAVGGDYVIFAYTHTMIDSSVVLTLSHVIEQPDTDVWHQLHRICHLQPLPPLHRDGATSLLPRPQCSTKSFIKCPQATAGGEPNHVRRDQPHHTNVSVRISTQPVFVHVCLALTTALLSWTLTRC